VTQVVNKFADFTTEEFNNMKGAFAFDASILNASGINSHPIHPYTEGLTVPASVDWRGSAVTGVKDQGQCGSCWAFSTSGAVEGARYVKYGRLDSFSEQQLVDCSRVNYGCGGGWPYLAMNYVVGAPLEYEGDYGYKAIDEACYYNSALGHGALSGAGYSMVSANNADAMAQAVSQQPVSVLLEADQAVFQRYGGGVLAQNSGCGTTLDHAVLLVGYASNYWIVKNSWGASWGEAGYIRLEKKAGDRSAGTCGVQSEPVLATA